MNDRDAREDGDAEVEQAEELTVNIPEEKFHCDYHQSTDYHRASYEDGEWVCWGCGLPLPDDVVEIAESKLSDGQGDYNYSERRAETLAEGISGAFDMHGGSDAE